VTGVALKDKLIVLLDVARLLSPEEIKKAESASRLAASAENASNEDINARKPVSQ
jgi:hypothetical protein